MPGKVLAKVLAATALASALVLLAPHAAQARSAVAFPEGVPWYNVAHPLTLADLKGRAVLLDFFTPGCINCIHMIPVEKSLAERFGNRLVIVAVDSPKFSASATTQGLVAFIRQYHIEHPVILDAHTRLWDAYGVPAWPTFVLIGPDGQVRGTFVGEQTVDGLAKPIEKALAGAPPAKKLGSLPMLPMAGAGAPLDAPGGLAVSGDTVAISDTGHNRIVLADRRGKVTGVVGSGCAGSQNGGYEQATFSRPHGLDFLNGRLVVADTDSQRIRVVTLDHGAVFTLAGNGDMGYVAGGSFAPLEATLNSPWDVATGDGALYVAMAGDHDIWRLEFESKRFGPWAGNGREGLHDGGLGSAEFAQTSGLAWHDGTLYAADPESSAIRAIDVARGSVKTLIGQGLFRFGNQDGPADKALLQHAEALVWLDGSLYIADTFNDAVRRLDLATGKVTTVASGLDQPDAIAVLAPDTLLVAEAGGDRIDAVHLPDGKTTPWTLEGLEPPPACKADRAARP